MTPKILKIPIDRIEVGLRARQLETDTVEFESLKESIAEHGLINPITVYEKQDLELNTQYRLICGERRLRVHERLDKGLILAHVLPKPSKRTALMLELDENRQRKEFKWQELVRLKGQLYATLCEDDRSMTQKRFSEEILGQHESQTTVELELYRILMTGQHPEIFLMDRISKAQEALKQKKLAALYKERERRVNAREKSEEVIREIQDKDAKDRADHKDFGSCEIYNDALGMLRNLDANSIDCCVTDPPFGIEAQKIKGRIGGQEIYGADYTDTKEEYLYLMSSTLLQLSRVLKTGAHLYMFFSFVNFRALSLELAKYGFVLYPHPIIWIKSHSSLQLNPGNCEMPDYFPAMSYHPVLFAFNAGTKRTLVKMGQPNVIFYPGVSPKYKTHPFEIPGVVYLELMQRSCVEGDTIIDPFCGSGNSIVSGVLNGFNMLGAEKKEQYRMIAKGKVRDVVGRIEK